MRYFGTIVFGTITFFGAMLLLLTNLTLVAEDMRTGPENWNYDYLYLMVASPAPCLALMAFALLFAMSLARSFRPSRS